MRIKSVQAWWVRIPIEVAKQHRSDFGQVTTFDAAILRIEQIYPFPENSLGRLLRPYKKAEVIWCQEEPENMGAWHFVDRRIDRALAGIDVKAKRPNYIGRPEAASPATGSARTHLKEQAELVDRALTI